MLGGVVAESLSGRGQDMTSESEHQDHDDPHEEVIGRLDEVTGALEELSAVLEQEEELAVILHRVCRQVLQAIPDTDMASVTLLRDGDPMTSASTSDNALRVDEAQYRAGDGPCLEAARTGKLVRTAVHGARQRWPDFADIAERHGVGSYLSAPLFIDSEYHGSLNLYGTVTDGFDSLEVALLDLYTTAAEAALQSAQRYLRAREHARQLRTALDSRAIIDQAKGIIMAVHRISADKAFELLVAQSQRENAKLRTVAELLVDRSIRAET